MLSYPLKYKPLHVNEMNKYVSKNACKKRLLTSSCWFPDADFFSLNGNRQVTFKMCSAFIQQKLILLKCASNLKPGYHQIPIYLAEEH